MTLRYPRCGTNRRCAATVFGPLLRRLMGQPTSPVSGREPLPALQATRLDHSPPRLGRHPLPKAMSFGALSHVRLIGPFHNSTSFLALNRGLERPVAPGGPVTSTRAIPYIVGANRSDALVGFLVGKSPAHGVPFRSQQDIRIRPRAPPGGSCEIERHAAIKSSGPRLLPNQDESRFDQQ
jgi:hypothetical protein